MKKLFIILCLVVCTSTAYAYDRDDYWTPRDYERQYQQRIQNERLNRIEDAIRQNNSYRTYRNQYPN